MNTKLKKALLIGGPVVLAIGVVYLLTRKSSTKPPVPVPNTDTPPAKVPAPVANSSFPLKNGSNNSKVKELQAIVGVTADGAFGPKTEAALISFAGVKQVDTQAELDKLKAQSKNAATALSNVARANDLIAKYNAGGTLATVKSVAAKEVSIDSYGAIYPGNTYLTLYGPKAYNRTDYTPKMATKGGGLVFDVNSGANKGTYLIDADLMTIQ